MKNRLPPVPMERPAANKRSPNRKPRYRRLAHQAGVAHQKEQFLHLLEEGLPPSGIVDRLKLNEHSVNSWRYRDPRFKAEMDEVLAEREEIAQNIRVPSVEDKLYQRALKGDVKAAVPFLAARAPELYGNKQQQGNLPSGVTDNRRVIVNILSGGEGLREAAFALLRALEAGASGDGGVVESGGMATKPAPVIPES